MLRSASRDAEMRGLCVFLTVLWVRARLSSSYNSEARRIVCGRSQRISPLAAYSEDLCPRASPFSPSRETLLPSSSITHIRSGDGAALAGRCMKQEARARTRWGLSRIVAGTPKVRWIQTHDCSVHVDVGGRCARA